MNRDLGLVLAASLLFLTAAGRRQVIAVRFHGEANHQDTDTFASPATLQYPTPHQAYIEKYADISEKDIRAMYPFQASDGTWGCAFKLTEQGRLHLAVLSAEKRGTSLVVFVTTKTFTHQVVDLLIDQPINDGIISIPRGLGGTEIQIMEKAFPLWKNGAK